jgi:hypothetical protein
LGFAVGAHQISSALVRIHQDREHTIEVKGFAKENVTSDQGAWLGTYTVRAPTIQGASAALATARERMHTFLNAQGVAEPDIAFQAIATKENATTVVDKNGNATNEVRYSYELSQGVLVTSGNVALVAALSQRATDLTNDGIMVSSDPPKFFYTGLEKLKLDLLAEATRNAYARARTLADNSGAHVGVLTSAEQGVFQVTAPYSNEISEDGEYDTTSIPKDVTAVVTLEYALEK